METQKRDSLEAAGFRIGGDDDFLGLSCSLQSRLADWTDWDEAMNSVAIVLGLVPPTAKVSDNKWVFWSNNPVGNVLSRILSTLTDAGVLLLDDEKDAFRWNPEYLPSKFGEAARSAMPDPATAQEVPSND